MQVLRSRGAEIVGSVLIIVGIIIGVNFLLFLTPPQPIPSFPAGSYPLMITVSGSVNLYGAKAVQFVCLSGGGCGDHTAQVNSAAYSLSLPNQRIYHVNVKWADESGHLRLTSCGDASLNQTIATFTFNVDDRVCP